MRTTIDELASALRGQVESLVLFDSIDSTQSVATRLIEQMDQERLALAPTLILAGSQSRGLGRGDRRWESPAGGLYCTWMRSGIAPDAIAQLPMLAAVAARDAVASLGIGGASIKWPNDIVVAGRKLAGLLIHARHGAPSWVAIGLGVNLETVPPVAADAVLLPTAVAEHADPADADRWWSALVIGFVNALGRALADSEAALAAWRSHLVHRTGEAMRVRLLSGAIASGTFLGLTPEGYLRLGQAEGERIITSGDVIMAG